MFLQILTVVAQSQFISFGVNPLIGTLKLRATDHYTAIRWSVHWMLSLIG